jgi:hypothetical protein
MSLFQFDFDECNLVFEVGYDHTIPLVQHIGGGNTGENSKHLTT